MCQSLPGWWSLSNPREQPEGVLRPLLAFIAHAGFYTRYSRAWAAWIMRTGQAGSSWWKDRTCLLSVPRLPHTHGGSCRGRGMQAISGAACWVCDGSVWKKVRKSWGQTFTLHSWCSTIDSSLLDLFFLIFVGGVWPVACNFTLSFMTFMTMSPDTARYPQWRIITISKETNSVTECFVWCGCVSSGLAPTWSFFNAMY